MFMKFCTDYEIFPDLIPKGVLNKMFHILATLSNLSEEVKSK